jgi:hypothetical protein
MNGQALNKKLDELLDELIEDFEETSLNIHTLNIFTIVLIDFLLNLGPYTSTVIYIGLFLGLMKAAKNFKFISILLPIFLVAYTGSNLVIMLSILLMLFLGLNKLMLNRIKERLYLLILAVFFQIGDGITTLKGLEMGFREKNPVLSYFLGLGQLESILFFKSMVIVLTFLIYFREKLDIFYLVLVYLIGFYLSISNFLVIYIY